MSAQPAADASAQADVTAIGRRLRELRRTRGVRQEQLAADCGISASYLSRIEAGERHAGPPLLDRLATALGSSAGYLFTGVGADEAEQLALDLRYAELALRSGEPVEAEQRFREARAVAGSLRLEPARLDAVWGHARSLEALGRLEDSIVLLEQLREDVEAREARWAEVMVALCRCYREAGDLARAVDVGEAATDVLDALGLLATDSGIRLTVTLVGAYLERGDVIRAAQLAGESVDRAERVESGPGRAAARWNASLVLARRGQLSDAIRLADEALALLGEGDDTRSLARLRTAYAGLLSRLDPPDPDQALALLGRARTSLAASDGSTVDIAYCCVEAARAHLARGELAAASAGVSEALELLGDQPRLETATALALRGRIAAAESDPAAAQRDCRQAARLLAVLGASRGAAVLWTELAQLLDEAGDLAGARDAYRAATACMGISPAPVTTPVAVASPVR
jgi:transcriptional regulator with XRE-family HTH domain